MLLGSPESVVVKDVSGLISSKDWYHLTDSGAFSLEDSAKKIARLTQANLGWGNPRLVAEALKEAITPEYLIQADGQPLIKNLVDLKEQKAVEDVFIWTVGDEAWQDHKIIKSGTELYLPKEKWQIVRHHKEEAIKAYLALHPDKTILAIDDKEEMVNKVKDLGLLAFKFKPSDPQISWQELLMIIHDKKDLVLFVDFDGVTYDTDRALSKRGSQLIVTKHFPPYFSASQI